MFLKGKKHAILNWWVLVHEFHIIELLDEEINADKVRVIIIHNYAVLLHLVITAKKTEHVTPLFIERSLLASWTAYPVFFITFQAPQRFTLNHAHHESSKKINHWELCSCSQNPFAKQAFNLKTNGGCSFTVAASTLWNSLPNHTKNCIAVNNNIIVQMQALKSLNLFFPSSW